LHGNLLALRQWNPAANYLFHSNNETLELANLVPSPRLTNLAAAFALAATDDMLAAIEAMSAMIAGAPATLATVHAYPGISLDTLRRFLRLTPSGAGRLVDRLAAAGLMERRAGTADQRFIALYLTSRGHSIAVRVLAARRAALRQPLTALTSHEQAMLEKLLDKMLYAMTPDRERCDHICRLCEIAACPQDICPVETAALAWEASSARRSRTGAKRKS
jgi:MarR family transcriptional regulator, negative regulator of the multidrug operon emrRAB